MADMWYYTCEGRQMEPVTDAELKRLAAAGTLKPTDLVWKDGMPKWVRASSTTDLFSDERPISVRQSAVEHGAASAADVEVGNEREVARRDLPERDASPRPGRDRRRDYDSYGDEDDEDRRSRARRRYFERSPGMEPALKIGLILGGSFMGLILIGVVVALTLRSGGNARAQVKPFAFPKPPPPVPPPVVFNPVPENGVPRLNTTYNVNLINNNADRRAFQLRAGGRYEVAVRAKNPNASFKVSVLDNDVPLTSANSVGANISLSFTAPHAGLFTIQSENLGPRLNRLGVTIRETGPANAPPNAVPVGPPPPVYRGPLDVGPAGIVIDDQLTPADARDPMLRSPCKVVTVNMVAGKTYTIRHERVPDIGPFDPYLRLEDSNNNQLAADDDGGGNRNALLIFRPLQTGVYRVMVTSLNSTTGNFTLKITES